MANMKVKFFFDNHNVIMPSWAWGIICFDLTQKQVYN